MTKYKGIILAGGMGSRLMPLTDIVNKFLLPVYNKPLIEYSIDSLKQAGITEIAVILGRKSAGHTIEYLKSGQKYGVNFTYFFQEEPLGVAHALSYAEGFAGNDPVVVMCADNIIYDEIDKFTDSYSSGAFISCKHFDEVEQLQRFAVLKFDENKKVISLEEKPKVPQSNFAFTGVQIYDNQIWDIIKTLKPSDRGEYEITHVLNEYINREQFSYDLLEDEWVDAGTPESLLEAQLLAFNKFHKIKE
ncbi:gp309 [Bacillus phage G]|uniref:glucose-1-phosphate thymidylyltransferase n=1 Tax=Bacillus phage G TaxID=2884420 RepID=G3MA50_9CAUD|nr:gp309 [Bacillus phage G]AEO93568.1 gp309 [Bacillus phage G]